MCSKSKFKQIFDTLTDNTEEIRLEENEKSAAIIHGMWNSTNARKWSSCSILIQANRAYAFLHEHTHGIYVTVNKINLRKRSGDCLDYIQFTSGDNQRSNRICGNYEATGGYTNDQTKSFTDEFGKLKMNIEFNDHVTLSGDQQFEIVVVLTAFRKGLINYLLQF